MSSIQTDRKAASDRFFDALEAIAGERQVIYFSPFVLVGDRRGGILGQLEIRVQTGIGPHDEIGVHLAFIGVPKAERRLGRGSRLMEIIVGAADAAGLPVDLNVDPTPSADDGRKAPVSKRDLRAWYGRFGFVPVRALGVDYLYRPARRSNPRTLGDVARRAGLHALSAWFAAPGVSEATREALRPSFARVGACDTPNDCTTRGVIDPPRIEGAADRSESDRPPPFWTPRETPPDSPERAATQLKEIIDAYRDPRLRPPDFGPMKRRLRAIAKGVDLADAASYDRLAVLSQWLDYEAPMEVLAERERDERAQMITDILAWTHPDFGDRKARTILRYDPTRGTTLVPLDTATTEELRAWHIEKAPKTVEFPTRGGRLDGFLRIDLWESAEAGLPHGLAYGDEEYAPEDATEEEREAAGFPNEGPRQAEESEESRGDRRLVELMREGWHPDHGFLRWPRNVADLTLLHERVVDAMNALDEQIEHRVGEGSHPEGRAHAKTSLQAGQRFDKLVLAELAKVEQAPRTNPTSAAEQTRRVATGLARLPADTRSKLAQGGDRCHVHATCPPTTGLCYPAAEVLWWTLGGAASGLLPHRMVVDGEGHWFLRGSDGRVYDPTASQYAGRLDYTTARPHAFLTAAPSRRAVALAGALGLSLRRANPAEFHRAAIGRAEPSAPVRLLLAHYGVQNLEILDFGSGRGTDAEALDATAYDPYHPDPELRKLPGGQFDLVLAIYVLNVLPPRKRGPAIDVVLSKVRRGGFLFVAVRTESEIARLDDARSGDDQRYQHGFTRESLLRELSRHMRGAWVQMPLPAMPGAVTLLLRRCLGR